MTKDQLLAALDAYELTLKKRGLTAQNFPHFQTYPTSQDSLRHGMSMIPIMRRLVDEIDDKAWTQFAELMKLMRWHGFLQGVMWRDAGCSMNELKDHNR